MSTESFPFYSFIVIFVLVLVGLIIRIRYNIKHEDAEFQYLMNEAMARESMHYAKRQQDECLQSKCKQLASNRGNDL